jgi:hypothetical protein
MLGAVQAMAQARARASTALARLPGDVATMGAFSIPQAEDPPYSRAQDQPTNYARSLLILAPPQP